jgi:TonB family protein
MPVLLERAELPSIPQNVNDTEFYLSVRMMVDEKGDVAKANLIRGIGIPDWDSAAIRSIKKWKYEPARVDGMPVALWMIQKIKVQVETPIYMTLSEIVCNSLDDARYIISKLSEGMDFGELAFKYSKESSKNRNGYIGRKDINLYPANITRALRNLGIEKYTQPLPFGKKYVIFKRMKT